MNKYSFIFILSLFYFSCSQSNTSEILEISSQDDIIIEKALNDNIQISSPFLAVSKDICQSCFGEITSFFSEKDLEVDILVIGANRSTSNKYNAIYHKSITFHPGEFELYDELKNSIPTKMIGFIRLVKDNTILMGEGDDLTQKTKHLLEMYDELASKQNSVISEN